MTNSKNTTAREGADYQKTLNLPKTELSMRAGLAQKEPKQLEKWAEDGLYEKIRKMLIVWILGKRPMIMR